MPRIYIALLCAFCLFSSCQRILLSALGMKKPKLKTQSQIIDYATKTATGAKCIFEIDTPYYRLLKSKYDTTALGKKYLDGFLQPLQALYFENQTGDMIAAVANCDGHRQSLRKLTWNYNGALDTFPARYRYGVDSTFYLNQLLPVLTPVSKGCTSTKPSYTVVIFWSEWVGNNAQNFIREIEENIKLSKKPVQTLYVNMDNFFARYTHS